MKRVDWLHSEYLRTVNVAQTQDTRLHRIGLYRSISNTRYLIRHGYMKRDSIVVYLCAQHGRL